MTRPPPQLGHTGIRGHVSTDAARRSIPKPDVAGTTAAGADSNADSDAGAAAANPVTEPAPAAAAPVSKRKECCRLTPGACDGRVSVEEKWGSGRQTSSSP